MSCLHKNAGMRWADYYVQDSSSVTISRLNVVTGQCSGFK